LLLPVLFLFLVVTGFFRSIDNYGLEIAVLGLRPYAYVLVLILGAWAVSRYSFELLSRYLLLVLVLELILAVYENAYGLPLFNSIRPGNRVTGTFSMPASLGIFAALVFAFASRFSKLNKVLLALVVTPLVYLTGSGTAFLVLALLLAFSLLEIAPGSWKIPVRILLVIGLTLTVLTLPKLVSRPDVYDSMTGRIGIIGSYIQHPPDTITLLFGHGLGVGSNIVHSGATYFDVEAAELPRANSDSMPMALLHQLGLVGLLLFYLLLAAAAWQDRRALPAYAVLFLAGMTVNLMELFPVNFLMGILMCRSLLSGRDEHSLAPT